MIRGNDIANVNGPIDLTLIVPRPAFVIAKVTQDATFVDKLYAGFRSQARQMEIGFGGYHYGDPQEQPNAEASCDNFIEHLGDQQDGEVAALDVEKDSGEGGFIANKPQVNQPWLLAWGRRFIKQKNYKAKAYVSKAGITDYSLNHPEIPELYDLWYAFWTDSGIPPDAPAPWKDYALWQYNADGIDKDIFFGNLDEFKATGHKESPAQHPYWELYWTPMQKILDDMVANSPSHLDAAFHASASNLLTVHKIAHRAEPSG